jgi:DNA polymerase type B, organellar and viral
VSEYLHNRIEKPSYLRLAPLLQGRGKRKPVVMGFDTEAIKGQPVLLQVSLGGGADDASLMDLPDVSNACLNAFVRWVDAHCTSKRYEYLMFGFNLQYEWTQLFGDVDLDVSGQKEFTVEGIVTDVGRKWRMDVANYRRHFARMACEETGVRVKVIDASSYYPGSLAAVAKMVGVEDKDDMDKSFLANLTRETVRDPKFRHYAGQDAVTTRLIGERIVAMHEEFDVTTCVSAPQLSAKVYRRQFLRSEIPLPGEALEQAGLFSYHGGKNGYYQQGPWQGDAWSLDKVSAYPEAMKALPALEEGQWTTATTYREGMHGLYLVRLKHKPCRYGGLFAHNGYRLQRGDREVWVTSYELDVMLGYREATRFDVVDGFVLVGPTSEGSGIADYVDRFFNEKRSLSSKDPRRATAKLMLNSLYGKFFQKQPLGVVTGLEASIKDNGEVDVYEVETAAEQAYDYRAGGLYHPPIASLITGFVRAQIHDLEHKHDAIATSTDGLFSRRAPDPSLVGEDLGMLTAEHGRLNIWRERLYAFGEVPSGAVNKVFPSKVALHGFRAKPEVLQSIPLEPGHYRYAASHPVTLREAQGTLRGKKYRPGEFAYLDFDLDLTDKS